MRYRKTIRIAKGLKINISKTGISTTVGIPGCSVNIGKKGAYLNTGIPGTGIYDRVKIGSSNSGNNINNTKKQHGNYNHKVANSNQTEEIHYCMDITDDGEIIVKEKNKDKVVTDENIIKQLKKTELYREGVKILSDELVNKINTETDLILNIHKLTPELINEEMIQTQLKNIEYNEYEIQPYITEEIKESEIVKQLEEKAKKIVPQWKFWSKKEEEKKYVNTNLEKEIKKIKEQQKIAEKEYYIKQNEIKKLEDKKNMKKYEQDKKHLENYIKGDKEFIEGQIELFLKELVLPVEFNVDYNYCEINKVIMIDIDLPEIENMPNKKANILASGKIKIKEKAKKEYKEDYLNCCCGMALFFAGNLFNINTQIKKILVSGYTQRLNEATGKINDEYIYSIIFDKEKLSNMNVKQVTPILAINEFQNIHNFTKTFEAKKITPLENV
ncbi:MAG: DUF4236 domain-containing protein [Cellulosilyticaceae bacterium]